MKDFDNLKSLVGGYFHEDWALEAASLRGVIHGFADTAPNFKIRSVIGEIDLLLERQLAPAALDALLQDVLGCAYDYSEDGMTGVEWLRYLREALSEEIGFPSRGRE